MTSVQNSNYWMQMSQFRLWLIFTARSFFSLLPALTYWGTSLCLFSLCSQSSCLPQSILKLSYKTNFFSRVQVWVISLIHTQMQSLWSSYFITCPRKKKDGNRPRNHLKWVILEKSFLVSLPHTFMPSEWKEVERIHMRFTVATFALLVHSFCTGNPRVCSLTSCANPFRGNWIWK